MFFSVCVFLGNHDLGIASAVLSCTKLDTKISCLLHMHIAQLIEDLRRELEHLQLFKLETEKPGRGRNAAGLSEYNAKTREIEMEHEVKRLKQVQWKSQCYPTNTIFKTHRLKK